MPPSTHIYCLGLNHTSAPLELRAGLALDENAIPDAWQRCRDGISESVSELVIVSTCNRVELYGIAAGPVYGVLEQLLSELSGVACAHLRPSLYRLADLEAVGHLFEVAAGLDSLILGEAQILGQIARALERAQLQATSGPLLNRLFQAAVHTGKRARTETAIGHNATSAASLAVNVAETAIPNLEHASVLVLGAGYMAELAVEALRRRGVKRIRIINRSLEPARALAQIWDAQPGSLDELAGALDNADVVIASTSAPHLLISAGMLQAARRDHPLVLIDIAMPRNIDPACARLPGVNLFDIETLNSLLEQSMAERASQIPHVRALLDEELAQFEQYLSTLDVLPVIADLHRQAEIVRREELERTLRHLPTLDDNERAHIAALTEALVNKLLDSPTRRLRAAATQPDAVEYAALVRSVFGLPERIDPPSGAQ